jgi:hypothetical protein
MGARSFAKVQTGHGTSCTMGTGSFPGLKRPGCGIDHPPPSSAEVKKGKGYTSTPSGPSGLLWGTFTFFLSFKAYCSVPEVPRLDTNRSAVCLHSSWCVSYDFHNKPK